MLFGGDGINQVHVVYVQNHVAVVGDEALAKFWLAAHDHQLAGHIAAGHRNDFDGQWELAQDTDFFTFVNDADKFAAGCGNDFFPRESTAAAFDQALVRIELVGAVNIDVQCSSQVQFTHMKPV